LWLLLSDVFEDVNRTRHKRNEETLEQLGRTRKRVLAEISLPTPRVGVQGVVVTAPGTTTLHFHAVDVAGNGEAEQTLVIKIDRVQPTVAFSGNLGSYDITAAVHIGCNASDDLSGLDDALTTCPTVDAPAYSLSAGAHSLQATATDRAGNVSTAEPHTPSP
jgi:hypothetical protein